MTTPYVPTNHHEKPMNTTSDRSSGNDNLTGEWDGGRCPRCGASTLANKRGDRWCSFVGGSSSSPCTWGLDDKINELGRAWREAHGCPPQASSRTASPTSTPGNPMKDPTDRSSLKPCPSCGGPAQSVLHGQRGWVGCMSCDLGVPYNHPHQADSVEVWNRRTDPPVPGGTCAKCGRVIYSNESSIHKTNGTDEHLYACPKAKP